MKNLSSHFLLCTIILLSTIQQSLYAQQTYARPIEKDFADTISIEFFRNIPIVPVTINGKQLRFMFDTGASFSNIDFKLFPENVPIVRRDSLTDTNGVKQEIKFIELCGLSIGKTHFPCYQAFLYSFDESPMFRCAQVNGMIGGDLLQKLAVKIDKEKKQLILTDRKKWFKTKKKKETSIDMMWNRPFIKLSIGEITEETVLFDTGASELYYLCNEVLQQLQTSDSELWQGEVIKEVQGANIFGAYGFAKINNIFLVKLQKWKLNNVLFKNIYTITKHNNHSIIGSELLNYGQVILDYCRKEFTFLPYNDDDAISIDNDKEDEFSIGTDEEGHLVISLIYENSDFYRQGMRRDDRVIAVNGQKLDDDLCALMRISNDEIKEMKLMDKEGVMKTINFPIPDSKHQ